MNKTTYTISKLLISSSLFLYLMSPRVALAKESEDVIVKFRALYSNLHGKQKNLPKPYTTSSATNPANIDRLLTFGVGGEALVDVFWTDRIATEFGVGLTQYRTKASTLNSLAYNFSTSSNTYRKRDFYIIPSYASLQFHPAPYGALRPYVGVGYHYTYVVPRSSLFKIRNGSGLVLQGGLDFAFKDDTYLNFDIKQYAFKTKIRYSTSFITDASRKQVVSDLNINPMVFGVGLGFKL